MNWNLYSILNNYGDFIKLKSSISPKNILKDLQAYNNVWEKYNPDKPHIPRNSLSVTSLTGEMSNNNISSLSDYYKATGNNIEESDFNIPTELYKNSSELQKLLDPWKPFLARTQFISLPPGGYFPTHIDGGRKFIPETFRLAVAIKNVNPPSSCWILGDDSEYKFLTWEYGSLYYVNTLKKHTLFNTSEKDSVWLIINIIATEESVKLVRSLI